MTIDPNLRRSLDYLISRGFPAAEYAKAFDASQVSCESSAREIDEKLSARRWKDDDRSGFVLSVGVGELGGQPAICVFVVRGPEFDEMKLIPPFVDGIPVVVKLVDRVAIGD